MINLTRIGYALARALQRPAASWIVIGLGVAAYAIAAGNSSQQKWMTLPGLSLAESAVFVLAGIAYLFWLIPRSTEAVLTRFQNDIVYREVKYFWTIEADGGVSGVIIYKVQNRTRQPQSALPHDGLIWFRKPDKEELSFRIVFRDGDRPHSIESENYKIDADLAPRVKLRFSKEHEINWSPKIFPPMEPGETVSYEVEIATPRTEVDAFSAGGSHIGFPVRRSTGRVEFMVRAPKGWRFELIPPKWSVIPLQGGEAVLSGNTSGPFPEGEGSILRWDVDSPLRGVRYVASYRLVAK